MKRLYRSKKGRILAGICSGIGFYLDVDPTVIRLVWAVLTLLSLGAGILAYLTGWIIIPEGENEDNSRPEQRETGGAT